MWTLVARLALALVVLTLAVPARAADGYKVVAHRDVSVSAVGRAQLARMFMKKTARWDDGTPVVVVDQDRLSLVRQVFSEDVHQKGADAVAAYWQTQVFSGRDTPPLTKKTDAEVLDFVRKNPGAIGYVSADADTADVKIVTVR